MPVLALDPRKCLFAALVSSVALGLAAPGCNAELETLCEGTGACQGTGGGNVTTTTGGGAGGSSGGSGGSGGAALMCPDEPQSGDIPCEVHAILAAKCHSCHDGGHGGGAPIDLLACERFHEIDCNDQNTRVLTAHKYVSTDFMPSGAAPDLTADEKMVLLAWLEACAPCETAGSACGAAPAVLGCYEQP
jgi:hypothetical protein